MVVSPDRVLVPIIEHLEKIFVLSLIARFSWLFHRLNIYLISFCIVFRWLLLE
jgi:hypothetical protein